MDSQSVIMCDIMCALDQRRAVFVVLLDLSAAFDTVDYHIFLKRLSDTFCIKDTALHWFSSYLQGRRNRVVVSGSYSCEHIMDYGLPHSVRSLDPWGFLFTLILLAKLFVGTMSITICMLMIRNCMLTSIQPC